MDKKYKKEFYLRNRERYLSSAKKRYIENREEILEKRRKLRDARPESVKVKAREYARQYRKENAEKLKAYFQTDELKYRQYYKQSAARRGREFNLSYEDFLSFFHEKCAYCGKEDARGIDRVDNDKGYILGNCVACCSMCNKMKWKLSKNEFLHQIDQISNYQNLQS